MANAKVQRQIQRSSRKDPLLPTTTTNEGTAEGNTTTRCGACCRPILVLLPILGCTFIIGSLALLSTRLGVSIFDASISRCLADYSQKVEVLTMIFIGATLMFITTKMRNIQINVYHQRQHSESTKMKALNAIAAISNILAYTGFVFLALFDMDGPGEAPLIHLIGAIMYFALSGLYAVLHGFLLCKQTQYPMICKVIFTLLPIATITCTIIYVANWESKKYEFEWFSVFLTAINVGLVSVLFMVDPVDDELRDFFCCRRASSRKRNSTSKAPRLS